MVVGRLLGSSEVMHMIVLPVERGTVVLMGRESAKLRGIKMSGARYVIGMRSFMFAKDVEE